MWYFVEICMEYGLYGPEAMCFDYNGIYASRSGPKNKSAPQLRLSLTLDFSCNAVLLRIIHGHFSLSEQFLFPSHMQKVFENVYFLYDECDESTTS